MLPKRLVFSGGGARIICHAGALKALEEQGYLRFVREFVGASAGSIAAFALAIGYTVQELTEHLLTFDFSELQDPNALDMDHILGALDTHGLDDGQTMAAYFSRVLESRGFSPKLSFGQLRSLRGVTLRILATDIQEATPFEFSPSKTPNSLIIDAVLASVAIPFYFQPRLAPTNKHWLADGAILYHDPLLYLSAKEQKESLCLCLCTRHEPTEKPSGEEDQFIYFKRIIQLLLQPPRMPHELTSQNTIYIETQPTFVMDFVMTTERKREFFESAYKQTQQSLLVRHQKERQWLKSPIARRHSIG
jgi:predicted acylesterase/phospholipase RssA